MGRMLPGSQWEGTQVSGLRSWQWAIQMGKPRHSYPVFPIPVGQVVDGHPAQYEQDAVGENALVPEPDVLSLGAREAARGRRPELLPVPLALSGVRRRVSLDTWAPSSWGRGARA